MIGVKTALTIAITKVLPKLVTAAYVIVSIDSIRQAIEIVKKNVKKPKADSNPIDV